MGWNTTVVVLNDALGEIERDPEFGKKLSDAIKHVSAFGKHRDVSAGNHCNAATVIESHHADNYTVVAVGENFGEILGNVWPYGEESIPIRVLKALADTYGYTLKEKK